jgi:hypothetical protein
MDWAKEMKWLLVSGQSYLINLIHKKRKKLLLGFSLPFFLPSSLAVLFLILDRCDQEKHRAASFVLPFGMRVQQFLRWLRFRKLRKGETGVN